MAFEARRARLVVVGLGGVLLIVVLGFVGYAHYRAHRFLHDLPGRLGIDIKQETDHVTYSQSYKGHTLFTVHAAKQIQHRDGKVTLKDVAVEVYPQAGKQAGSGSGTRSGPGPVDRMRGSEFEYDQKNGLLTAVGETFLDLVAPGKPGENPQAGSIVHVKTSGLVYRQKERTVFTREEVEFQVENVRGGLAGKAVGASYGVDDDILVLDRQVAMQGVRAGKPVALTAGHAEFHRNENEVELRQARYVAGGDAMAADHAVIHMRDENTPQRVEAEGHISLSGSGRGQVSAERLGLDLGEAGQPRRGVLSGGVMFKNVMPARDENGTAGAVDVAFDQAGRPVQAVLTGGVAMQTKAAQQERRLRSGMVRLALGGGGKERVFLRGAVASGPEGAVLSATDQTAKGDMAATEVRGNTLTGRFRQGSGSKDMQLTGLDGVGRTSIERLATVHRVTAHGATLDGATVRDTSTGETLAIVFAPGRRESPGRMVLARVQQQGEVRTLHEAQGRTEHGRADSAMYEAEADTLKMQGKVELTESGSELYADQVVTSRSTGVSEAEGQVRVGYAESGKPGVEPVHVIAEKAISTQATGLTRFTAAAAGKVRMWQGGAQVEAPVIDLDRPGKRLIARSAGEMGVRAVLPGNADRVGTSAPLRIAAREMEYQDATREIMVQGPVRAESRDGRMEAQAATVFLTAAGTADDAGTGMLSGRVERMVGTGQVQVQQPGRSATGDRLVYTAADGLFVLSGSKRVPPRLEDEVRGTVTGASLRFKMGEDSVVVTGADGAVPGRVQTQTRLRQNTKAEGVKAEGVKVESTRAGKN